MRVPSVGRVAPDALFWNAERSERLPSLPDLTDTRHLRKAVAMLNDTFQTPNLEFCRQEAKQLLKAMRSNQTGAVDLFRQHHPTNSYPDVSNVQLSDTQLIIARQHGFQSWAAMKSETQLTRKRVAAAISAAIK